MLKLKKHIGQSALEYSVLISVAIAALLAMQIYMKHSYEGKLRSSIDEVGKQSDVNGLEIDLTRSTTGKTIELSDDGDSNSTSTQETTLIQNSNERVPPYNANDPIF